MFIMWKIRNMRFVGNIIVSTKYEFYFDDVTVTFAWRCHAKYPVRSNILFPVYRGQKDLAQMPFTLRCDQCIVKSVLQDQQCTFWSKKFAHGQESVVDKERPGRHQNNTTARSFLIDNTFLTISKLITPSVYCWFRIKHLSLCSGHNSGWIMAYALAFAHGKRITEYCSLRDPLNGNVAAFNVDKWRHSDVIVIKLTAGTQHKIPYKTYINWKLPKLCCFVTYLWNDPRTFCFILCGNITATEPQIRRSIPDFVRVTNYCIVLYCIVL